MADARPPGSERWPSEDWRDALADGRVCAPGGGLSRVSVPLAEDDRPDRGGDPGAEGLSLQGDPGAQSRRRGALPARPGGRGGTGEVAGRVDAPGGRERGRPDQADHDLPARPQGPRGEALPPAPPAGQRARELRTLLRRHHPGRDPRGARRQHPAVRDPAAARQGPRPPARLSCIQRFPRRALCLADRRDVRLRTLFGQRTDLILGRIPGRGHHTLRDNPHIRHNR